MAMWATFVLLLIPTLSAATTTTTDVISTSTVAPHGDESLVFSSNVYIEGNMTLAGPGGFIATESSFTAAYYFGNPTSISGIALLASTQAFLGGQIFLSSVSVITGGREIHLSTTASHSNLSISTSGEISFFPPLHTSSFTAVPGYATTNTRADACVTGSTITIVTGGGRVQATMTGPMSGGVLGFMLDGRYVGNMSPTAGLSAIYPSTAHHRAGAFSYLTESLSPGYHSFCLTLAAFGSTVARIYNSTGRNIFYITEIR